MPIPLLVQLGAALLASKMQADEENKARANNTRQKFAQTQADIASQRASRAGDAGYMQNAIAGFNGMNPTPRRNTAGPMLAQMGTALLSQDAEPAAAAAQTAPAAEPMKKWAGSDLYDDKWSKYA